MSVEEKEEEREEEGKGGVEGEGGGGVASILLTEAHPAPAAALRHADVAHLHQVRHLTQLWQPPITGQGPTKQKQKQKNRPGEMI